MAADLPVRRRVNHARLRTPLASVLASYSLLEGLGTVPAMSETLGPFTRAFISLVEEQPPMPTPSAQMLAYIGDDTPGDAAAVLRALAHHNAAMLLLGSFAPAGIDPLSRVDIPFDAPVPWGIDPAKAINVLSTAGGERYLYLGWKNGRSYLFYLDSEAEAADEAFSEYGPLDDGWRELAEDEKERFDEGDEDLEHVELLLERAAS